jgi:hypothetical protein
MPQHTRIPYKDSIGKSQVKHVGRYCAPPSPAQGTFSDSGEAGSTCWWGQGQQVNSGIHRQWIFLHTLGRTALDGLAKKSSK